MRIFAILLIVFGSHLFCSQIFAQNSESGCIHMEIGPERDECFERAVSNILAGETAERGNWQVRTSTSAIDDSKSVFITNTSNNQIAARFGNLGPATMTLRCVENTTAALFNFNGNFLADIQGYGRVTYRVDDRQAKTVSMQVSTNNEVLGLWRGGVSIPFIRELLGADKLVVRATPFNQSAVEVTFDVGGLDQHLGQLREACHW